ncbi:MAG: helix-turn-helix domain-containing protein [Verrucomicrobiota bacterium]
MSRLPTDDFYPFGLRGRIDRIAPMEMPHRHLEIEIFSMSDGPFIRKFNQETIVFNADEVAIFWGCIPHQLLQVSPPGNGFISYIPLHYFLNAELPTGFTQSILAGECFRLSRQGSVDEALSNLKRWLPRSDHANNKFGRAENHFIMGSLHMLAEKAIERSAHTSVNHVERVGGGVDKAIEMIHFIIHNFQQPIQVKDIGESVKLNANYARSLFSRIVGITLHQFLLRYRLDHAKYLLASTNRVVLDIAMACGFGSLSQFYASFKREFSISPSQYRDSIRL